MNTFFIKVANKLGFLNKIFTYSSIQVNRQKVYIPIIKGLGRDNLHMSEIWMCSIIEKLLTIKNKHSFMDIGVNIGQTLIKLRSVNSQVVYYGFEPNPICVQYVKELIKSNKYENTSLFPVGIADKDQFFQLAFYSQGESDPSASIVESFRPNHKVYRREYVPCFSFETINKNVQFDTIGILKIDVEGGELEVLTGLKQLLNNDRPFVLVEILPAYNAENKTRLERQSKIEALLSELNYNIYRVAKSDGNALVKIEKLQTIGIHDNINWSDYVMIPKEIEEKTVALF